MAEVTLQDVRKEFGSVIAVRDLTLTLRDGEFVTLLGPSGCGKTTSLRIVAGFIAPTTGRVVIGDRVVSDVAGGVFVPPEQRGIGMVFQSYAVWPHMTVFANVAYPLKIARTPTAEMTRRVNETLDLVKMTGLLYDSLPQDSDEGELSRKILFKGVNYKPKHVERACKELMEKGLVHLQAGFYSSDWTSISITDEGIDIIEQDIDTDEWT